MNIATQLAQFQSAEAAALKARQQIITRLDTATEIITAIRRKCFYGSKLPSPLEWTKVYNKKGAEIVLTDSKSHPVKIVFEGKTYPISSAFVYGSTWDIAKETRLIHRRAQYRTWMVERDEYARKVKDVDTLLESEIAKIQREADHKIAELKQNRGEDLQNNKEMLAQREHQIARCVKWAQGVDAKAAEKAAKQTSDEQNPPSV